MVLLKFFMFNERKLNEKNSFQFQDGLINIKPLTNYTYCAIEYINVYVNSLIQKSTNDPTLSVSPVMMSIISFS